MSSSRPALFLDRDGVLNVEIHRLHEPEKLVMIPGTIEAVASANRRGIPVVVITNQAGIGRGLYGEADYAAVQARMAELLAAAGARIDASYHCPHAPSANCRCRKPLPGMIERAVADLGLDVTRSVMVGDKVSDLELAQTAGCRAVLVRTGYGRGVEAELLASGRSSLFESCFDSLAEAVPQLLPSLE